MYFLLVAFASDVKTDPGDHWTCGYLIPYVSKELAIINSDNSLLPARRQAFTWSSDKLMWFY